MSDLLTSSTDTLDDAGTAELIAYQRERIEWLKSLNRPTAQSEYVLAVLEALRKRFAKNRVQS